MKKKLKNNQNTSIKKPAIVMGIIAIFMIILIIISNIKAKLNSSKSQIQLSEVQSVLVEIDKNSESIKLIDNYFQALNEKDAEKLINLFPKNNNYTIEKIDQKLKNMYETYENQCGKNVKLTYKLIKTIELKGQALENSKTKIAKEYGIKSGITNIYSFEINITRVGDIGTITETTYLNLAKINEIWCII